MACIVMTALCAICSRYCCRSRTIVFELIGRIALLFNFVLLAPTASSAGSLLQCYSTPLSATAVSVLDGGKAIAATIGSKGTADVLLLEQNSFFVCWAPGGSHIDAATFAVVTLFFAIFLWPASLFFMVIRDPWLRSRLAQRHGCSARIQRCICRRTFDEDEELRLTQNAQESKLWMPILGDFRPRAWYTKFMDICLTLLLAALQVTLARPRVMSLVIFKATVICVSVIGLAGHIIVVHPYRSDRMWMGWVRCSLLLIAAGCAIMNAIASAIDLGTLSRSSTVTACVTAASVVLVVAVIVVSVLLFWWVGKAMINVASLEQIELMNNRRLWRTEVAVSDATRAGNQRRYLDRRRASFRKSVTSSMATQNDIILHNNPLTPKRMKLLGTVDASIASLKDDGGFAISAISALSTHAAKEQSDPDYSRFNPLFAMKRGPSSLIIKSTLPQSLPKSGRVSRVSWTAVDCVGCTSDTCVNCNSPSVAQYKLLVQELEHALQNHSPHAAQACCQQLCEILRKSTAMSRKVLIGALLPASEFLTVHSFEPGVIHISCETLRLIISRAFDIDSCRRPRTRADLQSSSLEIISLSSVPSFFSVHSLCDCDEVSSGNVNKSEMMNGNSADQFHACSLHLETNSSAENIAFALADTLRNLRLTLAATCNAAGDAAVAVSAVCRVMNAHACRACALDDAGVLLHTFFVAGSAEALCAVLCACYDAGRGGSRFQSRQPESQSPHVVTSNDNTNGEHQTTYDDKIDAAVLQALSVTTVITVHHDASARFIAAGGIMLLKSILLNCSSVHEVEGNEPSLGRMVAFVDTIWVICNLAQLHALDLLKGGIIQPLVTSLELVAQCIDGDMHMSTIAEPLCWTIERLAYEPACCAELSALKCERTLKAVLKTGEGGACGENAFTHAKVALRLLRTHRKKSRVPADDN